MSVVDTDEMRLDGNAVGGDLAAMFGVEMTTALRTCATCFDTAPLATHVVYAEAAGIVVRCPSCDDVALTLVRGAEHRTLTLRGALRLPGAG
jgi:hypothetical protein